MKNVYINSVCSISAQKTYDNSDFLDEVITYNDTVIPAVNPNYKDFIPPSASRRMAKGIKMSIVAAKIALNEADLENVDAIITGTGMGGLRDSEKFLKAIIENEELYLTPTPFIQSTHNTVGGQIALELGCKGYNFTYVHSSVSFESALLDATLQLQLDEANNILIGGVDELADYTVKIHRIVKHIKAEEINSNKLLASKTKGAVFGEGANFFVLSNKKQTSSYAKVLDVKIINTLPEDTLEQSAISFLEANNLQIKDLDLLILGNNGDIDYDHIYDTLSSNAFNTTPKAYYKHLCGEFNTASSFGIWLAAKILKTQQLPNEVQLNTAPSSSYKTVLLYNQYRGENHSFVLLGKD
ncbi:beta-ketoacyl synthase N-terminal-like domain-containing protein [Dokdonia sp.]|uniref:beta-ketoacyl synthase N-terminal-like domain-containing protein n=1 Tax=Dokdonia sp. TaxID=2024995 RepID=UPI0032668B67